MARRVHSVANTCTGCHVGCLNKLQCKNLQFVGPVLEVRCAHAGTRRRLEGTDGIRDWRRRRDLNPRQGLT
jgi:hypothetical protein